MGKVEQPTRNPSSNVEKEVQRVLGRIEELNETSKNKKPDMVNSPSHYNTGKIEVIEAIDDWKLGFYEGQVVKYVARAKHKGNEIENLKKAQWYLNRLITLKMGEKPNEV